MGSHRVRHDWSNLACMHALEKEMATHSSVLAWRIPGMEEPGGLPSVGSHRVRHDWSDLAAAAEKGDREGKNKDHFQVKESSWMLMCEYPDPILPQFYMRNNTSIFCLVILGLPSGLNGRESPANSGDVSSIPGSGRSLGGGNGSPLQYSCLGNPMDRGAWRATVHGVAKESDTT